MLLTRGSAPPRAAHVFLLPERVSQVNGSTHEDLGLLAPPGHWA